MKKVVVILFVMFLISACGEGVVEVENKSYQPKISIDGFLHPGKKVERIHIFRNFKLGENITADKIFFDPAKTIVKIIDEESGTPYTLTLNQNPDTTDLEDYYYEYNGNDLVIDYGKSYTLDVTTEADGKQLSTTSTTTIPNAGFHIAGINTTSMQFAQQEPGGDFATFQIEIERAPGTNFYVAATRPLDMRFENFITNHLFGELTREDFDEDLDDYDSAEDWIQNTPLTSGTSTLNIFMFDLFFYSEYRVIVFAADDNYREYLQTFNSTQEPDGNFHAARFNFEGDGIGVFGSVVTDTIYFEVTR
ncbi:MAG: DUF4249 family protein [Calditrichaeota bacterium]|nr:DUF4249 family protein [Calditrichota bacterium]